MDIQDDGNSSALRLVFTDETLEALQKAIREGIDEGFSLVAHECKRGYNVREGADRIIYALEAAITRGIKAGIRDD